MTTKTILITGCSSGIGADAARGMRAAGWRVLATCRKPEDVEKLRSEGFEAFALDLADPESIARGFALAQEKTGGAPDALFNNAAFATPGAVEDLPPEALREIFETNLFGLHDLTRRSIGAMRAKGGGRIVQCSSVLGLIGIRWRGAYAATKYALEGLTQVLRLELRGSPVRVILLNPGPIPTRFRLNSIPHFERWIDWKNSPLRAEYEATLLRRLYHPTGMKDPFELPPSAVTRTLLRALEARNPKPHYYVTHATRIAGAIRRFAPDRLADYLLSKV